MAATQDTLYWLKAVAGKSTLPAPKVERVLRTRSSSSENPIPPVAMLDFVVYLLYRAGSAVVAVLPLPFLFAFGEFLGVCTWTFSGKYRRLATRNLEIAFANEKSPRELRPLVRRHFRRLGANLLCGAKLTQMPPEKILEHVEVENIEAMAREFRAGV